MKSLMDFGYLRLFKPLLFAIDTERAHRLMLAVLSVTPAFSPVDDPPQLRSEVFGLSFSNPVGLAAGMDKDASAILAWNLLGFGFCEVGTITPRPQTGNPRPRIWRLPEHHALINRLGFPSDGQEMVATRLECARHRSFRIRLGLNLGPNSDTPGERIADDFLTLIRRLEGLADFIVFNLSSPNTPGLRELQAPERIRTIINTVRTGTSSAGRPPRILLKLAPDLAAGQLRAICDAALELGLDGIVATNTTLARETVGVSARYEGGLSGEPLKLRARATIAQIYRSTHGRIPIIGVGGVSTAEDAYAHIRAGASLIELYTGLVYQGPAIVHHICDGLVRLLADDGFGSINQAIGVAVER